MAGEPELVVCKVEWLEVVLQHQATLSRDMRKTLIGEMSDTKQFLIENSCDYLHVTNRAGKEIHNAQW